MVVFWYSRKKFGTNIGHNSLSSMLRVVHDVRDKDNKNHDVGPIMRYLKVKISDIFNCPLADQPIDLMKYLLGG